MKTYLEDPTVVPGSIYLKVYNNEVEAYGDMQSLIDAEEEQQTGQLFDASLTIDEWNAVDNVARIENGEIVLGLSPEQLLELQEEAIRYERDRRLRKCDKMSPMHWNVLTAEQQTIWENYRIALLNIPQQEGFPWDGDIERAPWPTVPDF